MCRTISVFAPALTVAYVLACGPLQGASVITGNYTYQSLYYKNGVEQISASRAPSLNDSGTIAFWGVLGNKDAILKGDGGPLTTIAIKGTTYSSFDFFPAINNSGTVVFTANRIDNTNRIGGLTGIFTSNGVGPTTNINGSLTGSFGIPAINNLGQVVFDLHNSTAGGIYVGVGGEPTLFTTELSSSTDINDSAEVAWGTSTDSAIRLWKNGTITTIATQHAPFDIYPGAPAINASGSVAFVGINVGPSGEVEEGIGLYNGITNTIVAGAQTGIVPTAGPPGINDRGDIVFQDSTASDVYVETNSTYSLVVSLGMPMLGSTLNGYSFYPGGFNNLDQVAFTYSLTDGRVGIALATPVPEPSAIALFALGAVGLAVARKRRVLARCFMYRTISVFAYARLALAFAVVALSSSFAVADTGSFTPGVWQGSTSDWFSSGNWTSHVPDSTTIAHINNGGTAQIASGSAVASTINLGEAATDAGSLTISDGTLSVSNGWENAGVSGSGTISQSGGTNTTSGLRLGQNQNSSGTYFLSNGIISTSSEVIGSAGSGTFNQSGGTNNISTISVGTVIGPGTYNLTGGTLNADSIYIGVIGRSSDSAVLNQTGGTLNASRIIYLSNSLSTLRISNASDTAGSIGDGRIVLDGASAGLKAGQLTANYYSGGELDVGLGGPTAGTDYGVLNVTGNVFLGSGYDKLKVTLTGGFTPTYGETFNIINYQSIQYTFSQVILPEINGHFDLSYTPTGIVLTANVVPEPATLTLFALGTVGLVIARRRFGGYSNFSCR